MFTVTLKDLRKKGACFEGYNKVVHMLQGKPFDEDDEERESYIKFSHDEPISLVDICKNNGVDDALWATRCVVGHDRDLRLFAVWCARQVQHLMRDDSSVNALDVAERFANGEASQEELDSALAAAGSAAAAAWAAWATAGASREAAWIAARAAWGSASGAAWAAAWIASRGDAWDSERYAQKEMFIAVCEGRAPWQGENNGRRN